MDFNSVSVAPHLSAASSANTGVMGERPPEQKTPQRRTDEPEGVLRLTKYAGMYPNVQDSTIIIKKKKPE